MDTNVRLSLPHRTIKKYHHIDVCINLKLDNNFNACRLFRALKQYYDEILH